MAETENRGIPLGAEGKFFISKNLQFVPISHDLRASPLLMIERVTPLAFFESESELSVARKTFFEDYGIKGALTHGTIGGGPLGKCCMCSSLICYNETHAAWVCGEAIDISVLECPLWLEIAAVTCIDCDMVDEMHLERSTEVALERLV